MSDEYEPMNNERSDIAPVMTEIVEGLAEITSHFKTIDNEEKRKELISALTGIKRDIDYIVENVSRQ